MSAPLPVVTETRAPSPLEAFTADIRRPRLSPLYTVGLAIVAFAMVLLPAIYLALIGLTGWGVLYHLTHNGWIMSGSGGGFIKLILYLGPAVAGGILVFFMLKPLFARRAKKDEPLSLDPVKETLLFAFVQRICQLVHAPMPCRIDVDCQVNASASFRRGLWSKDLVLTVGLPLAAGLDMRQFAGVLAHEFGHFAQGAGMRLTYVIRNINFWFARVVYERDKWDVQLEQAAKSVDLRLGVMLHAARGCVWLTRRILWALMHAGTAISCFMLRQMEYDADSYEAKVAGSDAFESTAARMQVLNVASQAAFEDVRQSWAGHRLPENLPLFIDHKAGALPGDIHQKLASSAASMKTGWFDTHPCDADRVRAARALNEPGVFRVEKPTTELFADFAETSKAVTRYQYEKQWELEFSPQNLVSSEEMFRESAANAAADAAIRKFYGGVNISLAPLLTEALFPPLADRASAAAQWREARERCEQLRLDASQASAEIVREQQRLVDFMTARHLTAAGFKVETKEFGLPEYATSVAEQETAAKFAIDEASNAIQLQIAKLDGFVAALRNRVSLALRLSQSAGRPARAATLEVEAIAEALAALGAVMPSVHQIGLRLRAFTTLAQNRGNHSKPEDVDLQMSRLAGELKKIVADIDSPLRGLPYPFPHPRGELTIVEYARYEKPCQNEWETVYRESDSHLDRMFALHYRLLGRLLVLAETAENELDSEAKVSAKATTALASSFTSERAANRYQLLNNLPFACLPIVNA
jgi:Zn-dependent protease with chaperone function